MGFEEQASAEYLADGDDVPDIFRGDIDTEEINGAGRVTDAAVASANGMDAVAVPLQHMCGLDLHTMELLSTVDHEIVCSGFGEWFQDVKAMARCLEQERKLGLMAQTLGVTRSFYIQLSSKWKSPSGWKGLRCNL